MKVIFVGMHNKPGLPPLCKSTKTGKLLQRVIDKFPNQEFVKSNLYDLDYYPIESSEKHTQAFGWYDRLDPEHDDLIILLGAEVHNNFIDRGFFTMNYAHPASKRSHEAMDAYVSKMWASIRGYVSDLKDK